MCKELNSLFMICLSSQIQ
uniref:Uncharacterized protein n=1 Tax=Arundo donax TaxID=35708 RepID=A0A0A9FG59_ARUDO